MSVVVLYTNKDIFLKISYLLITINLLHLETILNFFDGNTNISRLVRRFRILSCKSPASFQADLFLMFESIFENNSLQFQVSFLFVAGFIIFAEYDFNGF